MTDSNDNSVKSEEVSSTSVAICVATFQRPKGLSELLRSFEQLDIDGLNVHLFVADNDPQESSRHSFETGAARLHFDATYLVESKRGIPAVRNRLVAEAAAHSVEFIAFADDDQLAESTWLTSMVAAAREHNADVVAPNLSYQFEPGTPKSIRRTFPQRSFRTGQQIKNTSTNGPLFRLDSLLTVNGPFDERLQFTGGSDVLLGAILHSKGKRIIYSDEAHITEVVPASRSNLEWVVKRSYREGVALARIAKWVNPSWKRSLNYTVKFVGLAVLSLFRMVPESLQYRELPLGNFREVIFALSGLKGMIFGLGNYEEYRVVHGE